MALGAPGFGDAAEVEAVLCLHNTGITQEGVLYCAAGRICGAGVWRRAKSEGGRMLVVSVLPPIRW